MRSTRVRCMRLLLLLLAIGTAMEAGQSSAPVTAARGGEAAVLSHMKLTLIAKSPAGVPIFRFMECRHYAKDHMKIAQVGVSSEGTPIFRLVPGDYCDRPPAAREPLPQPVAKKDAAGPVQAGLASWYGAWFNGQTAASGETYDMEQLTAAHRTLPFGTRVRVQRADNGKSVEVRINDRGPYIGERIIDLSRAAARRLDMMAPGTAQVSLAIVSTPAGTGSDRFGVQAAAFRNPENARRYRALMERAYGKARIVVRHLDIDLWAVLVGEVATEAEAELLAAKLRGSQPDAQGAFVVRLDELAPVAAD